MAGLCSYTDVSESRVSLCDIAVMNELLDVRAYNNWLTQQYAIEAREPPTVPNPFDVFRRNH